MNRSRMIRVGVVVAVAGVAMTLAVGGYGLLAAFNADAPPKAALRPSAGRAGIGDTPDGEWVVSGQDGGFVGFRIRERIATVAAPNDVVGRSPGVSGSVTIAGGAITATRLIVDMRQLHTDVEQRDRSMRDRGLELDRFPTAAFTLTRPVPLGLPPQRLAGRIIDLRLPGKLTLHGVTREVIVPAQARWDGATIQAAGSLQIRRDDFGLRVPDLVGFKIQQAGVIEFELTLQRKDAIGRPVTPSTLHHHVGIPATAGAMPGEPTGPPCGHSGRLPAGGGRLVFAAAGQDGQGSDLYLVGADGTGLRRLTDGPDGELDPSWSPDGRRLAYVASPQAELPPPAVHLINADGTRDTNLAGGQRMEQPAWSPDGGHIAFVSHPEEEAAAIYLMRADGTGQRRLTTTRAAQDEPAFSPDGRHIALTLYGGAGNDDIAVINTDGSGLRRLTSSAAYEYSPAWSPDGARIAYARDGAIHVMRADGTGDRAVTRGGKDSAPAWSPDGTRLSWVRDGNLYLADSHGRQAACLATGMTVISAARWQPTAP
jgi:polyisoprenoid-binding protein YceI